MGGGGGVGGEGGSGGGRQTEVCALATPLMRRGEIGCIYGRILVRLMYTTVKGLN